MVGRFDEAACREVIAVVDNWRGSRIGLTVFSDVSGVEDYDVAARELVSDWLKRLGTTFDEVHILVSGRTIAWAIRIVSVVSRAEISSYHSKETFQAAFQSHVQGRRGRAV